MAMKFFDFSQSTEDLLESYKDKKATVFVK